MFAYHQNCNGCPRRTLADILSFFPLICVVWVLLFSSEIRGEDIHTPVIITQKAPIEILSAKGEIVSVAESSVGAKYTFVGANASQVTLQDEHGTHYRIAIGATNYTPATTDEPLTSAKPGKTALPASDNSGEQGFAVVVASLERSGGHLTPEIRSAYLAWQEQSVLAKLNDSQEGIPADCLAEVRADPVLRDAMFGAIDPPDPSILQNYARLRAALGAGFVSRYRSLVVAAAVAMRTNGARVRTDKEYAQQMPDSPSATESPLQIETDGLVEAIADFMTQNNIAALDLYQAPDKQQRLVAFLQAKNIDANLIASVSDPKRLHDLLKQAMVKMGQRPARRELPPDEVTWLRYLVSIYETRLDFDAPATKGKPTQWLRFPMDKAPWPILMPLYHPYPLGEARYIWEKYQGEHGPDRYHTYGPYKKGEPERILELTPSSWNWNAWPDVLVHGGICTIMSTMATETHVSLGEPAVMAGQPGHSNLMTYREADGFWYTAIEQAFAGGPEVTYGGWMFNEIKTAPDLGEQSHRPWASSEYQIGLAQAMNVGLNAYIDTRIAVNIYSRLTAAQQATLGTTLLTQATQANPYNAAPWQLLATQTTSAEQGLTLAQKVVDASKGNRPSEAEAGDATASSNSSSNSSYPKPVERAIRAYWNVLIDRVISEAISSHPLPQDKAATDQIYAFLQSIQGLPSGTNVAYRVQEEGAEAVETELEGKVHYHLESGKDNKKLERSFAAELHSFLAAVGADARKSFLDRLKALFPADSTSDPYLLLIEKAEIKAKNNP
jgi:hypothetical protein